ncbi:glycoside hydrolase family 16 protein [Russula dissimulans]|nr:glycoside hydrolase family 16 protein [Russula dissimulans]
MDKRNPEPSLVFLFLLASLVIVSHYGEAVLRSRHHHVAHRHQIRSRQYNLVHQYSGYDFLDESLWTYFSGHDPTRGNVTYVPRATAVKEGLAYVQNGVAFFSVDSKSDIPLSKPNKHRASVRITSTASIAQGLLIADFLLMPHGCAVWPAFWLDGFHWPYDGEIDIVEGINKQESNQISFHAGPHSGCLIDPHPPTVGGAKPFLGRLSNPNCESSAKSDTGCGWSDSNPNSYGYNFNKNGGGVFALEWRTSGIKVWFFERKGIPQDILSGHLDPDSWPIPSAFLSNTECNIQKNFNAQKIILDISLGGWANTGLGQKPCTKSLNEYLGDGATFRNAKWGINFIKYYN